MDEAATSTVSHAPVLLPRAKLCTLGAANRLPSSIHWQPRHVPRSPCQPPTMGCGSVTPRRHTRR
jgi:hypothetical protein